MSKPALLFLLGYPKSGTTLLGNLLAEAEGVVHAGELHYLWSRDLRWARTKCGCGSPIYRCDFWRHVLSLYAQNGDPDAGAGDLGNTLESVQASLSVKDVVRSQSRIVHNRLVLAPALMRDRSRVLAEYAQVQGRILAAIAEVTDAQLIIDSSKLPGEAVVAQHVGMADTYFILMVRDPRGVLLSRQRKLAYHKSDGSLRLNLMHLTHDALGWLATNSAAEYLCHRTPPDRWMRIRYEDFVADPVKILRDIGSLTGLRVRPEAVSPNLEVRLRPNHVVGGNMNKYRTGIVQISEDVRWRDDLGRLDLFLTDVLTAPLRWRYNYPVHGRPSIGNSQTRLSRRSAIGQPHHDRS